ncbi:FAD binding domain-containing protein [Fuscovulum ytuae]|uniref:Xanthine dehydrogenase family protein subunit M n=1 Tax=Fuscovulum ytuae TaxID=3042299 RepID=A0ABY8QAK8_9RHOB|nr:xanthine dehydrogenase family protein subunit M [Fuscovulum sp. YMD61]WGV17924.1 xanthine dehydrogenase family protein subunit M [Fuscovulum sp. YMD61]
MKAAEFGYLRPGRIEDALQALAAGEGGAMPLAGGQSLMPMMNFRVAMPERLIDLGALAELRGICDGGGHLVIGAMTRWSDLMASEEIAKEVPLLARALPEIAHPAIRNRGTIGGSVALADPAAEVPAVLLALEGVVVLRSLTGERRVAAGDFFLGHYETARGPGELIVALEVPKAGEMRFGFHEIGRRHGDFALAGAAVAVTMEGARVAEARIALFGVADRAIRATGAEVALRGAALGDGTALDRAVAALAEIDFAGDIHASAPMRRHLAGVAIRRAWAEAVA